MDIVHKRKAHKSSRLLWANVPGGVRAGERLGGKTNCIKSGAGRQLLSLKQVGKIS